MLCWRRWVQRLETGVLSRKLEKNRPLTVSLSAMVLCSTRRIGPSEKSWFWQETIIVSWFEQCFFSEMKIFFRQRSAMFSHGMDEKFFLGNYAIVNCVYRTFRWEYYSLSSSWIKCCPVTTVILCKGTLSYDAMQCNKVQTIFCRG